MRALLVDVGNTRIVLAAWREGDGQARWHNGIWTPAVPLERLATLPTPADGEDDSGCRRDIARLVAASGARVLALVSVVPRVDRLFEGLGPEVRHAGDPARLPFAHRLVDPAATGADRLCNVAAAVGAGLHGALVVDAGTATTIDVLREGVFEGGVIAPGMAFALEAIGLRAARLRPVRFAEAPLVAGPGSEAALAAGAFHAGVGGVEALISGLQAAHGPLPVVVTGGLGRFLAGPGRFHDPDWTLRGAALLAGNS